MPPLKESGGLGPGSDIFPTDADKALADASATKKKDIGPTELRVIDAFTDYDGDACRPEHSIEPKWIAETVLREHCDLATCFCPLCVLAREVCTQ